MSNLRFSDSATLDRLQSSNVAPLDAHFELSNWGEGANITYGYSQKEKGRVRRQAYRPFQEASSFLRYLAGTP